jgi:hypothetical protein
MYMFTRMNSGKGDVAIRLPVGGGVEELYSAISSTSRQGEVIEIGLGEHGGSAIPMILRVDLYEHTET